ncbi:hypothetical protein [Enterococcus innesii]|uniref:hypothetical protein n=1 Tax=Enterococcus innesii TaxID=2839759 RepID=UPI0022B98C89|nr:hypothetical protein [Enterococcus innesii]
MPLLISYFSKIPIGAVILKIRSNSYSLRAVQRVGVFLLIKIGAESFSKIRKGLVCSVKAYFLGRRRGGLLLAIFKKYEKVEIAEK